MLEAGPREGGAAFCLAATFATEMSRQIDDHADDLEKHPLKLPSHTSFGPPSLKIYREGDSGKQFNLAHLTYFTATAVHSFQPISSARSFKP